MHGKTGGATDGVSVLRRGSEWAIESWRWCRSGPAERSRWFTYPCRSTVDQRTTIWAVVGQYIPGTILVAAASGWVAGKLLEERTSVRRCRRRRLSFWPYKGTRAREDSISARDCASVCALDESPKSPHLLPATNVGWDSGGVGRAWRQRAVPPPWSPPRFPAEGIAQRLAGLEQEHHGSRDFGDLPDAVTASDSRC